MQKCIGILYGNENGKFGHLTQKRPGCMLPFGGRYRLIDIALSNMANNDFSNVVLYCGEYMRSTLDHIGSGAAWELNRRRNGLAIFPKMQAVEGGISKEILTYYSMLDFYRSSKENYVFIIDPMKIGKVDLSNSYDQFIEEDLDVLLLYRDQEDEKGYYLNVDKIITDSDGNIKNIGTNLGREKNFKMLVQIGFMKKDVFIRLIEESVENRSAESLQQAIINNISRLKIGMYNITERVEVIKDIESFYRANMSLLDAKVYEEIFFKNGLVLTKSKDEPSCLYGDATVVNNSLVANGCEIEGMVENSIIFRGVKIGKGAIIRNSIIFEKTEIQENAVVVNAILDKRSIVKSSALVMGATSLPYTLPKYSVVE